MPIIKAKEGKLPEVHFTATDEYTATASVKTNGETEEIDISVFPYKEAMELQKMGKEIALKIAKEYGY